MPLPDIDGFTFTADQAVVAAWLDRVAPARPPEVAAAFARLYQRVEQVYGDVQTMKAEFEALKAALVPLWLIERPSVAAVQPRYPFKGHAEAASSEREAPTIDTGGFSYGPDNPSGPAPTIDTGGFTIGPVDPAEEPSI